MIQDFITNFADKFYKTFIVDDRWKYLTNGLKNITCSPMLRS